MDWIEGNWKKHKHPSDQFFLVLEGEILVNDLSLREGDGLFVPGNTPHSVSSKSKSLVLCFEKKGISSTYV